MTVPKINFKKFRFLLTVPLSVVIILFLSQISSQPVPLPQIEGISIANKLLSIKSADVNAQVSSPYQDIGGNVNISGDVSMTGKVGITGNVGIGTANPGAKLDIAGGDLKVSGFKVAGFVGSAKQTTAVNVLNRVWADLTGTGVTFTLPTNKTVHLTAFGSVTGNGGGTTKKFTHCGFRFVITPSEGSQVPYGNSDWGDQIVAVGTDPSGPSGWWTPWHIERDVDLASGTYTAALQMDGWGTNYTDVSCRSPGTSDPNTSNYDYGAARLWVEAR